MSYITPSMILTPLINVIIGGVIGWLLKWIAGLYAEKRKAKEVKEEESKSLYDEIKKCKDCDRSILHEMILQKCNAILIRGYVTPEEIDEIEYLYKPYANINGNHRAGNAVDLVYKLPRKKIIEEDKK